MPLFQTWLRCLRILRRCNFAKKISTSVIKSSHRKNRVALIQIVFVTFAVRE